jgi:hypothetical protein
MRRSGVCFRGFVFLAFPDPGIHLFTGLYCPEEKSCVSDFFVNGKAFTGFVFTKRGRWFSKGDLPLGNLFWNWAKGK